jgi:aryl-alcohol dehydrogenase-like predicted oxidoreductase
MTQDTSSNLPTLPRRAYGNRGDELSIVGMGGIVLCATEQDHANRVVDEAVEYGVNYFDVPPSYGGGEAEQRLGPALKPYRQGAFLACKTGHRDAKGAAGELAQSLERLQTDHLDLYQLHGIIDVEKDVDAAFAAGGAMEVFIEAKKDGRVRHLGFSAHSEEAAMAAMDRYEFDSILLPLNFATYLNNNFGPRVVEAAVGCGMAVLALKTAARQKWPEDHAQRDLYDKCWYEPLTKPREINLALKFTMSQPVTAALPPGDESLWRAVVHEAMNLSPLTEQDRKQLEAMAQPLDTIFP